MKSFNYIVTDEAGIHARPAGLLVKEAKKYNAVITIKAGDKSGDATRLMGIMAMGIKSGTKVTVQAEGDEEDVAIKGLEQVFKENL